MQTDRGTGWSSALGTALCRPDCRVMHAALQVKERMHSQQGGQAPSVAH